MERIGFAVAGVYASLLEGYQDVVEWVGGHRPVIALALLSTVAGTGLAKAFPLFTPYKPQPATINLLEAEWECTQSREIKVDDAKVARINGVPVPIVSTTTAQMCERFELKEVE